jgi:hypothetical protein
MSLTAAQQQRTSSELRANIALSGLSAGDVQAALGFTAERLEQVLSVGPAASPADVWLLRDYLEQRVLAQGGTPVPYTVLTSQARQLAAGWFRLRPVPGAQGQAR